MTNNEILILHLTELIYNAAASFQTNVTWINYVDAGVTLFSAR